MTELQGKLGGISRVIRFVCAEILRALREDHMYEYRPAEGASRAPSALIRCNLKGEPGTGISVV